MSTERDPPRLSEGGDGIPPALSRALGAARARLPADAVLSAVAAHLPPGPPGGGGGSSGPGTRGTSGSTAGGAGSPAPGATLPMAAAPSVWSGVFIGAALGALVGGGSLFLPASGPATGVPAAAASAPVSASATGHQAPAKSPVPVTSPEPGAPMDSSPGASPPAALAPSGAQSDGASPAPADSAPSAADSASASPAETEADYLRRAHAQIASSPSQALSLAEAHPLRYPDGKLGQEREMIVIGALAALGRTSEAEGRARAFIGRFPDSAHRRRLEVLVPSLAEPPR